ncbi:MAG: tetratricopeptide repeat protein [Myxococcales bacterium]|nr:tetratricopeptide repeat protein [Myxococcales bacterium]
MREADEEIREIKKEIIESRGLTIKTNNLVNALGADIKSIAKRQAGYERRFNWNSAVVYVLVATLSFAGLKLASDARIREIEAEKTRLSHSVRELRRELDDETRRAEERSRAEAQAGDFYDLIRQQQRAEVVAGYDAISHEKLSRAENAFFRDTYDRFRLDLSVTAYQNGLDLMRTGRYAEAAEKLQESIRLKDEAAHIPAVKYQLARALRRLGRQSEALVYARQVVEQNTDRELQDDAMWLMALCAEELDDIDAARDSLRTLIRRWPRSSFAHDARPKLRDLTRQAIRGHTSSDDAPAAP